MTNEKALADWIIDASNAELIAGIIVMSEALKERTGVAFTWPTVAAEETAEPRRARYWEGEGVPIPPEAVQPPWMPPTDDVPPRVTEDSLLADEALKEALTALATEWVADQPSEVLDDSDLAENSLGWATIEAVGEWVQSEHYPSGSGVASATLDALQEYALSNPPVRKVGQRMLALLPA